MAWEALHSDFADSQCQSSLKRFQGRPDRLSPKAWLMTRFLGYREPFDRHDWIVDRRGREVRYIIDFYPGRPVDGVPASFYLDVRPALDSVEALVDRVRVGLRSWVSNW